MLVLLDALLDCYKASGIVGHIAGVTGQNVAVPTRLSLSVCSWEITPVMGLAEHVSQSSVS